MALAAGDRLGPYEVISLVGAGGMGEVYRARDPRVNRDVAIKTSTSQFSERFGREARAVAALNHPNICTLYDVGPDYLVMEYVEGDDLKGPLPLDEALPVARQIADALDAAHAKGVIHRDLKPGNIKVTPDGTVKVLDFGLAKIADGPAEAGPYVHEGDRGVRLPPDLSQSPTMIAATQAGIILGTAAYMSPEQARGKTVDTRTDIWAFGVVLYELITGEPLFRGEDVSETLAAVIRKEPDWTRVPHEVRRLLKACLEKAPKNRLRDIGDVWRLLDPAPREARDDRAARRASALPWMIATAVALIAAGAVAFIHFRQTVPEPRAVRFQIPLPDKTSDARYPSISPDGRHLAFAAAGEDGRYRIWIRDLDALASRVLPGTEGAMGGSPFWSPDSHFIGFFAGLTLKTIDISGGRPVTMGNYGLPQGAWGPDGTILVGSTQGIKRITPGSGTPSLVTKLVRPKENGHSFPYFLPDGTHFIYTAFASGSPLSEGTVYVGSLRQDMKELLIQGTTLAEYVAPGAAGRPGHLIYNRSGTLTARPFDSDRLQLLGDAFPISQTNEGARVSSFSVSATGVVAYSTVADVNGLQLTWFDREGRPIRTLGEAGELTDLAVSRDGKRVAVAREDADIWLLDDAPGAAAVRSTTASGLETNPVWSPDGQQLAYSSNQGEGSYSGYVRPVNGSGQDQLVAKGGVRVRDWRGGYLIYDTTPSPGVHGIQMWYVPLAGDQRPVQLTRGAFDEVQGQLAPDPTGAEPRWIAFTSNASSDAEIYVEAFPAGTDRVRISTNGGHAARWRADGKELFYLSRDETMMAVDIDAGKSLVHGVPRELFKTRVRAGGRQPYNSKYSVSPDGKRFLIIARPSTDDVRPPGITVVLNWLAGVKK
ncbi:MAG TPA: protein kinase [Vicinamibacterales bacterium]|jgi:Tol biopolymer transport system component/predicted Ser/Thr protein kinase